MRKLPGWAASLLFSLAFAFPALGGGGPQNLALVVNAESWASMAVANEFISLRGIPLGNVIYLDNVPNFETVDIDTFREQILKPVLKIIESRHLKSQIDYLVYSSDIPYAVDTNPDHPGVKMPQVITPIASITGLTYLHERVLAKDVSYLNLNVNRYTRYAKIPRDHTFTETEQKSYVEALQLMDEKKKKYEEALPLLEELRKTHPKNSELLYNLACCLARVKKLDESMIALNGSIEAGWFDAFTTRDDNDLAPLRERQDFKDALAKLEKVSIETLPELGFRSSAAWNEKCEVSPDGKGEHYLLSSMLAVTSGRGTSVREAIDYLRRAKQSDGTHPTGTIYYLMNGDVRAKTRRWAFPSAVAQLQKLGVKAELIEGILPKGKPDVMGAMIGISDFDWNASGSTILPGAICEHLTSCGGELAQYRSQTACSAFLRAGAAGTSGAVQEPYALQQKFPTPFIHVHYARGCSLGESFYQSVSGPYQLIVVGDPLCAPWLNAPVVTLNGIKANETLKGTVVLIPFTVASVAGLRPDAGKFEFLVDGVLCATANPGGTCSFISREFCDGYHEVTLVGIDSGRIAAQGRAVYPVTIDNQGQNVTLTARENGTFTWDQTVHLSAKMKGASTIDLFANGRLACSIKGDEGSLELPARTLGLGAVKIQAFGKLKDDDSAAAASIPILLNVEPAWMPAQTKNAAATKSGVRVDLDDGTSKVVAPTRDTNWIAKAGLAKAHACTVEAWFNAASDDLYQFQIQTPLTLSIEVDGVAQPIRATGAWQFVPLALRKGAHRFRIKADAANADPKLDIRFGASGTHSLEAKDFECSESVK